MTSVLLLVLLVGVITAADAVVEISNPALLRAFADAAGDLQARDTAFVTGIGDTADSVLTAADAAAASVPADDLDTFWLLLGGILVFFMQPGFALLEAGCVRVKNTKNILFKNVCDACVGALGFWSIGYSIAYADDTGCDPQGYDGNKFLGSAAVDKKCDDVYTGGGGGWFMAGSMYGMGEASAEGYAGAAYSGWFFQFAFAATAATIVSGGVAERITFPAYLIATSIITVFIYPVVVHWGWSSYGWASAFAGSALTGTDTESGLLFKRGVLDFAGCAIVHMVGGCAALMGIIFTGPRIGRFDTEGKPVSLPQQSATLQALGVFILWFGWYGFNCASTLALSGGAAGIAGKTAVTTTLSPAAACGTCMILYFLINKELSLGAALNGILAGLVGITSACSTVEPWAAVVIGMLAGMVYIFSSMLMVKLKLDDVVDAVAVHGMCGAWGCIAPALFASKRNYAMAYGDVPEDTGDGGGVFMGGDGRQLGANFVFVLAVLAWTCGLTGIIFAALKFSIGIRVSPQVETLGMDVSKHGGSPTEKQNDVSEAILFQKLGGNKVHPA